MSKNRNLADLLDSTGDVKSDALDNVSGLPDAIDVNASAPADSLNIDSSGKVGIGTSSPSNLIELDAGSGTNAGITIRMGTGNSGANDSFIGFENSAGTEVIRTRYDNPSTSYVVSSDTSSDILSITRDGRGLSQFTAKVWINFNGTGTIAIRDSHNVSSITDNNTGVYTVNFSNNLGNDDYSAVGTTSNVNNNFSVDDPSHLGNFAVVVQTRDTESRNNEDSEVISLIIFGD